jgi:hypothetical protein
MIQRLKIWWENRKGVVLDFVLPKLDLATDSLAQFLISKGTPQQIALPNAREVITWLKQYLRRQL